MGEWEHWTDPSTSTDELVASFGLEPLPTWEQFAAERGIDLDDPRMEHLPSLDPFQRQTFGPTTAEGEIVNVPPPLREEMSSCGGGV